MTMFEGRRSPARAAKTNAPMKDLATLDKSSELRKGVRS